MVTVTTSSNPAEAELLQSLLADAGIQCFVPDELFGAPVRIMVPDEKLEEAKRILAEAEQSDDGADDDAAEDQSR